MGTINASKVKTPRKTALWIALFLALGAALGVGIWFFAGRGSGETVYVYPFQFIGMTEYWGDSQESYGPVSSDNIQTVYLSETQTVTEISVKPGDKVKKGDLLLSFDTTLDDLKLERKRLDVEKQKLELESANNRLREIRNMVPMQIIVIEPDYEFDYDTYGKTLNESNPYVFFAEPDTFDGSSEAAPLVLWLHDNVPFHTGMLGGEALVQGESCYVAIRITEGNRQYTAKKTWTGLKVTGNGIQFFTPMVEDPFMRDFEGDGYDPGGEINIGGSHTAAQIAQMRKEQEKKIKELEFQLKMTQAEYKLMEKELNDGNIYSEVDGEVVSVLTEEEAKTSRQPVVKVSGGGGYYVEGYVSELEKDKLEIGHSVTVNDWNNGMTYEGSVDMVGDFPAQEQFYNGMGNPNASYYPFRVFVDGSADLQTDSYVSLQYSTTEGGNGVYLENPFVRTEKGSSYVLVLGADGKLEKRTVVTGKSLWGNYTEIRSGITPEDLIAFPYGKHVKPGVRAEEGDMSNLYG